MRTKIDLSKSREDIFYKLIYPLYPREFMLGDVYETFAQKVSEDFVLNSIQWEYILEHWEKRNFVTI